MIRDRIPNTIDVGYLLIYVKIKWHIKLKQEKKNIKGCGFLSFNMSNKYGQKFPDQTTTSDTDDCKTAWKRAIQKTVEEPVDLVKSDYK